MTDIVERLRIRWEKREGAAARKISAILGEAKEAADEIERLRSLAQQPLPVQEETVAVPKAALDWLFGEGPDASGHWFGDGQYNPKHRGAFWWRAAFRSMLSAPTVGGKE